MKKIMHVLFLLIYLIISLSIFAANAEALAEEVLYGDFARASQEINQLGRNADVPGLMRKAVEIDQSWKTRDIEHYGELMVRICAVLRSDCSKDEIPIEEIHEVARRALETYDPRKNNISTESHYQLLGAVQGQHQYLVENTKGSLSNSEWKAKRKAETEQWMVAWDRMEAQIDPGWDPNEVVYLNVAPPPETLLPPGVSPDAITDPELRAQYEESIEENNKRARHKKEQNDLRKLKKRFTRSLVSYFSGTYSIPPFADEELSDILTQYIKDAEIRKEILDALEEKKGNVE